VFSLSRAALIGRDFAEAERYAQEWLRLSETIGDRSSVVGALSIRGMIVINLGEYDRSRRYFEAALARGEGLGETFWTSGALFGLGVIAVLEGDYEAAALFWGNPKK
jgi:tetratricopeptide (TPR) repeat protein